MEPLSEKNLHEACETANVAVLRQWLAEGGEVNTPVEPEGLTPLALVARAGAPSCVEAAELLLSHGAKAHTHDAGRGSTALHWAALGQEQSNNTLSLRRQDLFLCLHEACIQEGQPWPKNQDGWGVLHTSVLRNSTGLILFLLQQGADVHERTTDGGTALHIAYRDALLGMAQSLRSAWNEPEPRNLRGQTPSDALKQRTRMGEHQFLKFCLEAAMPLPPLPGPRRQRL